MTWRILIVSSLVLIAGCSSGQLPESGPSTVAVSVTDAPSPLENRSHTPSATRSPTQSPTPTATPTPEPPSNPWKKEPIAIGIDRTADPDRNYTVYVIEAVDYWHTNHGNSTEWSPRFTVRPNDSSPDIVIRFVNDIRSCGRSEGDVILGCASLLEENSEPDEPEIVLVNLGLTGPSTFRVVRHELGHILGLEHGEGPEGVMTQYTEAFNQVVRVHVDLETTAEHEKRDTENQLRYVFEYYSSGAEGFLSEQVEFALVEEREAANVVIDVNEEGGESRAYQEGDQVVIEINGIRTDHRGWHAGYWIGFYFGANETDELPPAFDEPESDPRSQWWH